MSNSSYRTILRSSSLIGGAQVVKIAASVLKMKAAAVLLGPVGVGVAGLYMNLIQTAATIALLGIDTVGTRQIAAAQATGGQAAMARTRRALLLGTVGLAFVGAMVFWLFRFSIAKFILDDESRSFDVALLSFGVALTVAAGSQNALLAGLRRVGDLARLNIATAVLGTIFGVLAIWTLGKQGVVAMVLVAPLSTFLLGLFYTARVAPSTTTPPRLHELVREWREMVQLGVAFMISGLVTLLGYLAVRTIVERELGPVALGQFQASWAVGMTYLAFVLSAMGTDYYPRLTAAIKDPTTATRLVNEQTEVGLILCTPILLAMLGCAPLVVRLLYSSEFYSAVEILRWQILGDVLKVLSWPLSYLLLASGAGKTFILTESLGMAVFVTGVYIGAPLIGVTATGIAFLALYGTYLPLVAYLARRRFGFRWSPVVIKQTTPLVLASTAVMVTSGYNELFGAILGLSCAGVSVALGLRQLQRRANILAIGGLSRIPGVLRILG